MPEKDRLPGETVDERDIEKLAAARANLDEYKRVRLGLSIEAIVTEVDLIPPISAVDGQEAGSDLEAASDSASAKVIPIHVHMRWTRDQLMVAQGTDDSEAYREIKKKAA